MLVLYDVALSPYAQKVKMALIEKGLPYEIRTPALGAADAAFTAANPRQEVPALLDDGFAVFDSSVILEYLEDKWPVPALRPEGAAEKARLRMMQEICDTQWEAVNWAMAEIRVMNRAEGAAAERILAQAARDLAGLRRWLARELGGHGWFGGEHFGLADIAVFPYVMGSSFQKEGPEAGSPLADWLARIRERPSAQRLLADAKAAIPSFAKDIRDKALSGERPRQYRDHRLEFMLRAGGMAVVERGLADGTIRFSTLPS
jgi:glutathione S-transferase